MSVLKTDYWEVVTLRNLIVHQRRYQPSDNNKHVDYWEVVILRNLIVHQRRYQLSDNNKHVITGRLLSSEI